MTFLSPLPPCLYGPPLTTIFRRPPARAYFIRLCWLFFVVFLTSDSSQRGTDSRTFPPPATSCDDFPWDPSFYLSHGLDSHMYDLCVNFDSCADLMVVPDPLLNLALVTRSLWTRLLLEVSPPFFIFRWLLRYIDSSFSPSVSPPSKRDRAWSVPSLLLFFGGLIRNLSITRIRRSAPISTFNGRSSTFRRVPFFFENWKPRYAFSLLRCTKFPDRDHLCERVTAGFICYIIPREALRNGPLYLLLQTFHQTSRLPTHSSTASRLLGFVPSFFLPLSLDRVQLVSRPAVYAGNCNCRPPCLRVFSPPNVFGPVPPRTAFPSLRAPFSSTFLVITSVPRNVPHFPAASCPCTLSPQNTSVMHVYATRTQPCPLWRC